MRYEEIPQSILNATNQYEKERGIITEQIIEIEKYGDVAFLMANKSDRTVTLFVALKTNKYSDRSWFWFCPSENQCNIFSVALGGFKQRIDRINETDRLRRV